MIAHLIILALQTQGPTTTATFETSGTIRPSARVEPGDGKAALTHLKALGELLHRFGPADALRVAGGAEVLHYGWSGMPGWPEDLRVLRLEGTYRHAFDPQWSGVAHASSALQFEEGAEPVDGGSYGLGAGALYRFGPELTVGALARVITRIEDRPYVFLQPYLEWSPAPSWTIRTESREGLGLEATHLLDEAGAWALHARLVYHERRFRLDEDAIRPEGIFEDARVTLAAGVRWRPSPGLLLSVVAGVDLRQEFTLEDEKGRQGAEFESDPGPLVGVHLAWTF